MKYQMKSNKFFSLDVQYLIENVAIVIGKVFNLKLFKN